MNEKVRIRMSLQGVPLGLASLTADGLTLAGETSASPRGLRVELRPFGPATEFRLVAVRQRLDWAPDEFRYRVTLHADTLVCRGVDDHALPPGQYKLGLRIADLKAAQLPDIVTIPADGEVAVSLGFTTDPRRIQIQTAVTSFDDRLRNILQRPDCLLDGLPAADWLAMPIAQPRRQACLLNVLAKVRSMGPDSLVQDIQHLFLADVDRVYARVTANFHAELESLVRRKVFGREGAPKSDVHRRLLAAVAPLELPGAEFKLVSYRQRGSPSLQAVVAVPASGGAQGYYADLDIDRANPDEDLASLVMHFGEVLTPGKTDHFKLARALSQGATADFHYYKVIQA